MKTIRSRRKDEDGGKLISLPVPSSAPVATRDRIKLARSVVSAGSCADKIVLQIVLQFWGEVGRAMYGCLSPRNYTNAQKQKIPRRIYIPPVIFQKAVHPMLRRVVTKGMTQGNKSGSRRTWAVTKMQKLELLVQPAFLTRSWPEKGIHEGAIAKVKCTGKYPVTFKYSTSNGVLQIRFTREATKKTGELLLSATTEIVSLVDSSGSQPAVVAGSDIESDGLM